VKKYFPHIPRQDDAISNAFNGRQHWSVDDIWEIYAPVASPTDY
jgi:hypothetical protein